MTGSLLGKTSQFVCFVLMENLAEGQSKDLKRQAWSRPF